MQNEYTILTRFRNKEQFDTLRNGLQTRGRSCYNIFDIPVDPNNPTGDVEEQMNVFENVVNFFDDDHFKMMFEQDLAGLKTAEKVIVLLPAGTSVHIEAGIAYGLGKHLILIGRPEKAESLYLIFKEHYDTIEDFLQTI